MEDSDAWLQYPQYRKWFDKLHLSLQLGYCCGPSGLAPSRSDKYIVRPTYNLSGMSAGARIQHIKAGDASTVEPGYFWCELFSGIHTSITYNANKQPTSAWSAEYYDTIPLRIKRWYRDSRLLPLPLIFNDIVGVETINAEFIGDKLIEIHFRGSPDPEFDELIPIWSDLQYRKPPEYRFVESFDDANGFLKNYRLGFFVK
jgi:hypothetical protein